LNSTQLKVGEVFTPNPKIAFDLAHWTIRPESFPVLDSIATFILINDSLILEIGVHTDSRVSEKSSMRLDQKRAESVVEYLTDKGISSNRLVAKGYGESQLIIPVKEINKMTTPQEQEEAHAQNRRTELKIIEIVDH
jgi:outer membrane protein OmpA-like peptidoglycan-associated protein